MAKVHQLKTNADGAVFEPNFPAKPGDTILLPEKFTGIYCPVKGTPSDPIIFSNGNRVVQGRDGINLENTAHVEVRGDGDAGIPFGIVIDAGTVPVERRENDAIRIGGFAKNILIRQVLSRNNGYGVRAKNESSCDPVLNSHIISGLTIQNCQFLDSKFQHLYIGSTNLNGKARPTMCNGKWEPIPPPQLGDITIENNSFDKSGRAAVQVSQCLHGKGAIIKGNKIKNAGRETEGQGNGMNFGLSRIQVSDNTISDSFACGIAAYACPNIIIENNTIDRSGFRDGSYQTPWAWAIWIDDDDIDPRIPTHFIIRNNTFGERGKGAGATLGKWHDVKIGKRFGKKANIETYLAGNIIEGNISTITHSTALMDIETGIEWKKEILPEPSAPPSKRKAIAMITIYDNGEVSTKRLK